MLEPISGLTYTQRRHIEVPKRSFGEQPTMFDNDPFDATMSQLRCGDDVATSAVFQRYMRRLIALAGKQFDSQMRERADVEDAVLSAFRSFFVRAARGEYEVADWDALWSLLAIITLRKCARRRRTLMAASRDRAHELDRQGGSRALCEIPDAAPSPLEAAILSETTEGLFRDLAPHDRPIVEYLLQGFTAEEIAARLDCSERTVRRVRRRAKQRLQRLMTSQEDGS
jgi:RNA polymerase sigma factor (sigma-70 family)